MTSKSITGSVVRADEIDPTLAKFWAQLLDQNKALSSPFLSFEIVRVAAKYFPDTRICIFENNGEVVGFLPFQQKKRRIAQAFLTGFSDVQGIVGNEKSLNHTNFLEISCNSVFDFDRMPSSDIDHSHASHVTTHRSPIVDLSLGYEAWLADKRKTSKGRIKRIIQKQRQITRELGEFDFEFASRSLADLDQLMKWKSEQYKRTSRVDRFAQSNFRNFVVELFENQSPDCDVILSKCSVDGNPVAFDLALRSKDELAGWFPAYDVSLTRYSVGNVCTVNQLEGAAQAGIKRVNLGAGDAAYKDSLSNFEEILVSGSSHDGSKTAVTHRLATAPRRAALNVVLSSPVLRKLARTTLAGLGSMRTRSKTPRL